MSASPTFRASANQIVQRAMEFNPDKRIQSAAALQAEVKKAIEMLERVRTKSVATTTATSPMAEHQDDDELPTNEGEGYVVMLVESKADLQNAVRERLKSAGTECW